MKRASMALCTGLLVAAFMAISTWSVNAQTTMADSSDGFQPNKDEHVVQPGDTLWDICDAVLGRPELWPRVWSLNPEITNPHWIYPGDVIRFYQPIQDLPLLADIMDEADVDVEITEGEDTPDVLDEFEMLPPIEVVAAPPVQRVPKDALPKRAFVGLFLTKQELKEAGHITNAAPERLLLAAGDKVYIKFQDGHVPQPGSRYISYRTVRKVNHPKSGDFFGYMTEITGMVQVVGYEQGVGTARVIRAVAEMERGQLMTPLVQSPLVTVYPVRSTKPLDGVILDVQSGSEEFVAEGNYVFIDRGLADGVQLGNRFRVLLEPEQFKTAPGDLGKFDIGTLLVVDAKDHASTCMVVRATQEISPGDRVRAIP
ncbi:MAG: LysM peptidoglycan-binding domain-containing protein [Myxococcota bacterium]|nr:LysM peptidoglycan-binding domain-containing protein [Myxococcota bacterium]